LKKIKIKIKIRIIVWVISKTQTNNKQFSFKRIGKESQD
jgi:hypothetical protein